MKATYALGLARPDTTPSPACSDCGATAPPPWPAPAGTPAPAPVYIPATDSRQFTDISMTNRKHVSTGSADSSEGELAVLCPCRADVLISPHILIGELDLLVVHECIAQKTDEFELHGCIVRSFDRHEEIVADSIEPG